VKPVSRIISGRPFHYFGKKLIQKARKKACPRTDFTLFLYFVFRFSKKRSFVVESSTNTLPLPQIDANKVSEVRKTNTSLVFSDC